MFDEVSTNVRRKYQHWVDPCLKPMSQVSAIFMLNLSKRWVFLDFSKTFPDGNLHLKVHKKLMLYEVSTAVWKTSTDRAFRLLAVWDGT